MSQCVEYKSYRDPMLDPERYQDEGDRNIKANCGHEVFNGEYMFTWENGSTLCPDCLKDKCDELSLLEMAELLGCGWQSVVL